MALEDLRPSHTNGLLLFVCVAGLAVPVGGQRPQTPVFRAASNAVSTDVRVHDANGRFVPGLRRSDFRVTEDGVEQVITTFKAIIGGREVGELVPSGRGAGTEGLILPGRRAASPSARIFVIFIDDMHLQPSDSVQARRALAQIRDEVVLDEDLVAFVSTGFSSIETPLTHDYEHRRFNAVIEKVMGSADTPSDVLEMPESSEGVAKLRHNAHVAFRTAYNVLAELSHVTDRRKAFIYVSSGYSFNPFRDSRYEQAKERYEWTSLPPPGDPNDPSPDRPRWENPFESSGQQFSETDLVAQLAELTRAARRANVVFYTVDPRGLDAGPALNTRLSPGEWREWITTTTSSLQILAEETGGRALVNRNDLTPGLQRIAAEMSDYYIIGYESSNPDPLRVRRTVEITTPGRPELRLSYRGEYTLRR